MKTAKKILLLQPTSAPITWLLRDNFSVAESAPLANPHICDVAGQFNVVDTTNKFSIAGGVLLESAANATNDPRWQFAIERAGGRMVTIRHKAKQCTSTGPKFGFTLDPSVTDEAKWLKAYHLRLNLTGNKYNDPVDPLVTWALDTWYYYSFIFWPTAGCIMIRDFQEILWEGIGTGITSWYCAGIQQATAYSNWGLICERDLGEPWATSPYSICTFNSVNPANGESHDTGADAIPQVFFTQPSSWAGAEVGLRFRIQDSQNYMRARFVGTGAATGSLKYERIEGGVVINTLYDAAFPVTIMNSIGVILHALSGNLSFKFYSISIGAYAVSLVYSDASFLPATNAECYCNQAFLDAGGTLTRFISYPRLLPASLQAQLSQGIV